MKSKYCIHIFELNLNTVCWFFAKAQSLELKYEFQKVRYKSQRLEVVVYYKKKKSDRNRLLALIEGLDNYEFGKPFEDGLESIWIGK